MREKRGKAPVTPHRELVTPRKARKHAANPSGQTDKIRRYFRKVPAFKAFAKDEDAILLRSRGLCPCCAKPGTLAEHCHESGEIRGSTCAWFNSQERDALRDAREVFSLTRSQGEDINYPKPPLYEYLHAGGISERTGLPFPTCLEYVRLAWAKKYRTYLP